MKIILSNSCRSARAYLLDSEQKQVGMVVFNRDNLGDAMWHFELKTTMRARAGRVLLRVQRRNAPAIFVDSQEHHHHTNGYIEFIGTFNLRQHFPGSHRLEVLLMRSEGVNADFIEIARADLFVSSRVNAFLRFNIILSYRAILLEDKSTISTCSSIETSNQRDEKDDKLKIKRG